MIDFDRINWWRNDFRLALGNVLPPHLDGILKAEKPKDYEDAADILFGLADREVIVDRTLAWIEGQTIIGYHGTRLVPGEVDSVRAMGLFTLDTRDRRGRLVRALSKHPEWPRVEGRLDDCISLVKRRCGQREGQVHLTLSRSGLTRGFNHYLTHGSEFDRRVAEEILGATGRDLLASDGSSHLIRVRIPGSHAIEAAHPFGTVEDARNAGDLPNLVGDIIRCWCYQIAEPSFSPESLEADIGMIFREDIPSGWIMGIDEML